MNPELQQALAIHRAGRLQDAERLYRAIVARAPDDFEALHLLGITRLQQGDARDGAAHIGRAAVLRPHIAALHIDLGKALSNAEDLPGAIVSFRRALALSPDLAEAHTGLGIALGRSGIRDEAEAALRRALELAPGDVRAYNALGVLLHQAGRYEEAEPCLRAALAAQPNDPGVTVNLALTLMRTERPQEARLLLERAVESGAVHPELFKQLGSVHLALKHYEAAIEWCRRAVAARPDYGDALTSLSQTLFAVGRLGEAVATGRAAEHTLSAAYAARILSAPLMALGRHDEARREVRRAMELEGEKNDAGRQLLGVASYASDLDGDALWRLHRAYGAEAAARVTAPFARRIVDRDTERRLRVGYLSSDLHDHPVGRNMTPLLEHRDRSRFEVFAYAGESGVGNPAARRLRGLIDHWKPIFHLSDQDAAGLIHEDRIDILVSLAGRFDDNRPQITAWRPAPIQISFHDTATSGLDAMDYLIADPILAPRGGRERFVERIVRLPSYYIHEAIEAAPAVTPLPMMTSPGVTFASFNNPAKITDATLMLWASVLRLNPLWRLLLKYNAAFRDTELQGRIRSALVERGVAATQLVFDGGGVDTGAHLALYGEVDLALDTQPFSGSTTTFEALWMGVPVVTLAGETMLSRWSASILRAAGLDELIARTPEQYTALAAVLAASPTRLGEMRATLRARLRRSPLVDGRARTRQIERLYRALWRRAVRLK